MAKVSVIVPNYNHAPYLRERMDTILTQTFQDFELILLDDCSTDDSRSILSSYSNNPRVSAIKFNEKNSGSTFKQWNKGVRLARGEYIWLAESDDYADPHFLERLVPVLDAKPQVAFVSCRSWQIDSNGNVMGYADAGVPHWKRYETGAEVDGREECENYFAYVTAVCNASSVLMRRSAYEKAGGADESLRLAGDRKLWGAMALTGRVVYFNEPLNYYRIHPQTVSVKAEQNALAHAERLRVSRWMLTKVVPSEPAREELRCSLPWIWPPAVSARRIPLRRRISILRDAIAIDRSVAWRIIPTWLAALNQRFIGGAARRVRELWAWWTCKTPRFPSVAQITKSIAALSALESPVAAEPDSAEPIFLFSTGMRTGSTLLQRILLTDSRLLFWGEPMGEMNIASRIAQMVSDFMSPSFLASWNNQPPLHSPELPQSWTAHLHPSTDNFRLALRNFFDVWLGCPARKSGFSRWGFKEVRLGASAAVLLRWLYPSAKFILLTRHPFDCYRSFADARWETSFIRYPDLPVDSAASFAREWNRIAVSWSDLPPDFPAVRIKYEDLTSGNFDFRQLESWLGLNLNENAALAEKVGRTAFRARLHAYERWIVSREAAPGMRLLGYKA